MGVFATAEIFCPFINGDCKEGCIFYSAKRTSGSSQASCALARAVGIVNSFVEKTPADLMRSMVDELSIIKMNSGSDHTESQDINSNVEEIKKILSRK